MGIMARYVHVRTPELETPGRLYLHTSGLNVFTGRDSSPIKNAALYAREALAQDAEGLKEFMFFIGILWGERNRRIMDLMRYNGFDLEEQKPWQEINPDVNISIITDGVWTPGNLLCEEGLIVLGREGEHRRRTASLEEFIRTPPNLGPLEPKNQEYMGLRLQA